MSTFKFNKPTPTSERCLKLPMFGAFNLASALNFICVWRLNNHFVMYNAVYTQQGMKCDTATERFLLYDLFYFLIENLPTEDKARIKNTLELKG